jgi:hypothetical protein
MRIQGYVKISEEAKSVLAAADVDYGTRLVVNGLDVYDSFEIPEGVMFLLDYRCGSPHYPGELNIHRESLLVPFNMIHLVGVARKAGWGVHRPETEGEFWYVAPDCWIRNYYRCGGVWSYDD